MLLVIFNRYLKLNISNGTKEYGGEGMTMCMYFPYFQFRLFLWDEKCTLS